jgi:hypothetical protein
MKRPTKLLPGHILNYFLDDDEKIPTMLDVEDIQWFMRDKDGFISKHQPILVSNCQSIIDSWGFKPGNLKHRNIWINEFLLTSIYIEDFSNRPVVGICIKGESVWESSDYKYIHELQTFILGLTGTMPTLPHSELNK